MAFCSCSLLTRIQRRFYSRSSVINTGIEKRVKDLTKPLQWLYPAALTLGKTTRRHVEKLKEETENLEAQFQAIRTQLQDSTQALDKTKTELQDLYLRRELEYRKTRSDVGIIREINETENILKEREQKEQQIVDENTKCERDLFEKTRTSHQALYESTRNYAKRYIVLGVVIGTVWTIWKSYQYTTSTVSLSINSSLTDTLIEKLEVQNKSLMSKIKQEIKSQNSNLKADILASFHFNNNDKEYETVPPGDSITNSTFTQSTFTHDQFIDHRLLVVSVLGGLIGSIVPLLLHNIYR